jgi:hypothetical protein
MKLRRGDKINLNMSDATLANYNMSFVSEYRCNNGVFEILEECNSNSFIKLKSNIQESGYWSWFSHGHTIELYDELPKELFEI